MIEVAYNSKIPTRSSVLSTHLSKISLKASFPKFMRKQYALGIAVFFAASTVDASYAKLAKKAGLSHKTMTEIVKKVVKYESTTGSYHTQNKKSGAYGRYQIMPRTASAYARKLHIPQSQWKTPQNQDKIFKAILSDNIQSLKRNGIKISAFSIYGTHQQGAGGFNAIVKKKSLSKRLERNLRHNLPKKLSRTSKSKLKKTWMNYWKKKFT